MGPPEPKRLRGQWGVVGLDSHCVSHIQVDFSWVHTRGWEHGRPTLLCVGLATPSGVTLGSDTQ